MPGKFEQSFSQVGVPKEILTDQGSNFVAKSLLEVYKIHGIKPIWTSPFRLVENLNGTLVQLSKKFVMDNPRDWDHFIPYVFFAYRETPQALTKFSPFELLYGRRPRGPLDVIKEQREDAGNSTVRPAYELLSVRERLRQILEEAHLNHLEASERQKTQYNKKAKPRDLQVDDEAVILLPTGNHKLETR
ncbi:hypothetical protein QYM36_002308 [Artemia franciscana]|uniref:Integrase catalytic domain-containing protein n=1 Tax=Artemia franciscana TaxID=6661 RepID=A0AA88INH5_ARTSF|nr:hypothetical protein QYM36_002308 [Artemia franciscana]